MLKNLLRAGVLTLAAVAAIALAIPGGQSASAGGFTATSQYAVRHIPVASNALPTNCSGNDCTFVSSADDGLYFKNQSGAIFPASASPSASVSAAGYTNANVTVDQYGRITGITNGLAPAGGGYTTTQYNASNLTQRSALNFTGSGASCGDNSGSTRTDCTFTGAYSINVTGAPYNCKGDNSTDNALCIQAAVDAIKTATSGSGIGGELFFPPGIYLASAPVNAQSSQHIRFVGVGGLGAGYGGGSSYVPPSTIIYTGTGSSSFIQLNQSFGSVIKGLGILYSSASFTGFLVDYGHASGSGTDATYNTIDDCLLGSNASGAWNAVALVSWNNGDFNVLRNSHLQGAKAGVRFRETTNDYAEANRVENSLFRDFQTGHIMNAGNQEIVTGCVFEGNQNQPTYGGGGSPASAPAYTTDITSEGAVVDTWNTSLSFVGNWIGDYPVGATQFDTSPTSAVNAYNLTFERNFAGNIHFGNLRSASIKNNALQGSVTFDSGGTYTGVSVVDNIWFNAVTYVNMPATAFVKGNTRSTNTTVVGDQMTLAGALTCSSETVNGTLKVASGQQLQVNQIEPTSSGQVSIAITGAETVQAAAANGVVLLDGNGASGSGFTKTWNNFYMQANDATSGAPLSNSPRLYQWPRYWNGSASTAFDIYWQGDMDSTSGPLAHEQLVINGTNVFGVTQGGMKTQPAPTIASATTITPVAEVNVVSGTALITTITAPTLCTATGQSCCASFAATGAWQTNATVNIATTGFTATVGNLYNACYVASTSKWYFR